MSKYIISQTGQEVQHILDNSFEKPASGIPITDLSDDVQTSLEHAESAYNQAAVNASSIEYLRRLYEALQDSDPEIIEPSDTWPVAEPAEGVIYRVVDRENTPPQYYTDYMWNGTTMVEMAQYNNAIDAVPTLGSHNLVESGGVASMIMEEEERTETSSQSGECYSLVVGNAPVLVTELAANVKWLQVSGLQTGDRIVSSAIKSASGYKQVGFLLNGIVTDVYDRTASSTAYDLICDGSYDSIIFQTSTAGSITATITRAKGVLEIVGDIENNVATLIASMAGKEDKANLVTAISSNPSNIKYPSEKAVAEAIEPIDDIINDVVITEQAKNLFNANIGTIDGIIATSGGITTAYGGKTTGLIPVLPERFYYLSGRTRGWSIRCLKADGTTHMKVLAPSNGAAYSNYYFPNADASGYAHEGQFKTPADAAFVQISCSNTDHPSQSDAATLMLEYVGAAYDPAFVPSPHDDGVTDYYLNGDKIRGDVGVKSLNVLLVGSSHGVNTISMFPVLAEKAGIDILCGNLYTGSATLDFYKLRPEAQIPYMAEHDVPFGRFAVWKDGEWSSAPQSTLKYALQQFKWDVIILQRGASENTIWNASMANYFQSLLTYIEDNCDGYTPRIYFNSGIANALSGSGRDSQKLQTNNIMATAKKMQSEFGISIIPTAVAVQYARASYLTNVGQWQRHDMASDSQHLDTGVGQYVTGCTVFETIIKDLFGMSVRELDYLPIYSDVSGNVVNIGLQYFTEITDFYSQIGKTVAALAVQDMEYKDSTATYIASEYGSLPTLFTVINTLSGCTNTNTDDSVDSNEPYMGKIEANTGLTITSVTVTMGGVDVTEDVYVATYTSGGSTFPSNAIRIGIVTGNIEITAIAE